MRLPNAATSVLDYFIDNIAKEDSTSTAYTHNCDYNGDPVLGTVNCDDRYNIISEQVRSNAYSGRTSGCFGDQTIWKDNIDDWFVIVGMSDELDLNIICQLWVRDMQECGQLTVVKINIYKTCILGCCECRYEIDGVRAQLKPCRVFSECYCRGEVDPDWEYILRGVCFGFRVIDSNCNSQYFLDNYSSINKVSGSMAGKLKKELEEEMVTVVSTPCTCVHPFGAVPKGDSDFRAIVDCSRPDTTSVNNYTDSCKTTFSYNSVQDVTELLIQGDYLATVDISNAYRAVNIHPLSRERQGLTWDFGKGIVHLRDNRLCMGLSSSPYVFAKISDFIVRCLVREGIDECINYLDDFCVIGRSKERCKLAQGTLIAILRRVGFYVSFKKLVAPAQKIRFLGIDIDSVTMRLSLPIDKLKKLKNQLQLFVRRRKATKKELERLAGILAHCCKVVHGGRTFSRRVYDLVALVKRDSFKIRLNEDFRLDLKWWIQFAEHFNGYASIVKSADPFLSVYSDSSKFGFGALHGFDWLAGSFILEKEGEWKKWLGHHFSEAKDIGCRSDNINVLELWPIVVAVNKWGELWKDKVVIFVTDNTQVRAALNTGRSRNKVMMGWLRLIFWKSIQNNFEIQSVYLNTKDNIICDSLSRLDKFKNIARIRDVDERGYMCCHGLFSC